MNCSPNIITANFSGGRRKAKTAWRHQWDRGQVLCVTGIDDLPLTFTAHFSVHKEYGAAQPVEGIDGQVEIPDIWLTFGKQIYCWIYITDGESGETVYTITIPVIPRPMPEYYEMEDTGVFDGVVADVAGYAEAAQASATAAAASATAAATSETNAAASEQAAETAQTAAETAQAGAEASELAAKASENAAAASEQAAEDSATAAAENALAAEDARAAAQTSATAAAASEATATEKAAQAVASATAAQASETAAAASETNAKTSEDNAAASESSAAASANSASASATSAAQSASEAAQSASVASSSATAAEAAQTGAETARAASEAAQTAAETAETNAETAQAAAEAAQTAAEEAAASLTVDDALSSTSTNPVQNKVITEAIYDMLPEETATGNPVSINDGAKNVPVKALTVSFSPKQDLNGYSNPWPGGGGKNKFPNMVAGSYTGSYSSTVTVDSDGVVTITNTDTSFVDIPLSGTYTFTSGTKLVLDGTLDGSVRFYKNGAELDYFSVNGAQRVITESSLSILIGETIDAIRIKKTSNNSTQTVSIMIVDDSVEDYAYAPYSNICPISGWQNLHIYHGEDQTDYDTTTISLPSTIYGGSVECVGGVGSATWGYIASYNGETLPGEWISDRDVYAEGTTPTTGAEVAYVLATPTSFATTPQALATLKGDNTIWSDSNEDLSVTYRADIQQYISNAISAAVAALS